METNNITHPTTVNGDQYSSPFSIQMASGEKGKHCDKFPHGSLHICQKRLKDGQIRRIIPGQKTIESADIIPAAFTYKPLVSDVANTKNCKSCQNIFLINWPFAGDICIRCFERENISSNNGFGRDDYRELLRKEILEELKK